MTCHQLQTVKNTIIFSDDYVFILENKDIALLELLLCDQLEKENTSKTNIFNSLRPRPNRRRFADDIFKRIFLNENEWISPRISLKFVPKVRINNIPALVQMMDWRRPGDKPLSEPMMVTLLRHICVTRPQWVKKDEERKLLFYISFNNIHCSPMVWNHPSSASILLCSNSANFFKQNLAIPVFKDMGNMFIYANMFSMCLNLEWLNIGTI